MKCLVVLVVVVAVVTAEAPSGWKPSGRRLILPSRQQTQRVYGPPPAEYGPPQSSSTTTEPTTPAPTTTEAATTKPPATEQPEGTVDASGSDGQSEQLKNVDNGVYYVLLPDGRLQRVQYMTSALLEHPSRQNNRPSENLQSTPSGNFQQAQIVRYVQVHPQQLQEPQQMSFNGFIANVQYTDVEPLSGPIYAYNPTPLIRILKK